MFSMCFSAVNCRSRNDNEVLIFEEHRNGIAKIVQSTIDSTILLQVNRFILPFSDGLVQNKLEKHPKEIGGRASEER